jgi:periplasmic protein TonB
MKRKLFFILSFTLFSFIVNKSVAQSAHSENEEKIYDVADEAPEFPGGFDAFKKYIADSIVYPDEAIQANAQGTIYIKITVGKDGYLKNEEVVRDPVGHGCAEEAIRVLKTMPPWKPGTLSGIPVSVHYTIPVTFVLKDGSFWDIFRKSKKKK